jgi:predicted deacetylase
MLGVARDHGVQVALSVIPFEHRPRLVSYLDRKPEAAVLVHGFAHRNHARAGHAKCEFGGDRAVQDIVADLSAGLASLRLSFGKTLLPVIVPPWNRMSPGTVALLPGIGFKGLSTWKPRICARPVQGIVQVNAHLDLIDWRRGKVVKDEALVAGLLLRKLRWRREHRERASEPLGLLTHHELWNRDKEKLVVQILSATRGHPAVKWLKAEQAFGF